MKKRGTKPAKRVVSLEDLMEMVHGYQRSMALFAALELGVFAALSEGPSDAAALARRISADPRRLAILMNALTADGLLQKSGRRYRNGKTAAQFLVDGPRSKVAILLHQRDCWPAWTGLAEKVRAGRKRPGKPKGFQEHFIRGMEDNARERAVQVAKRFPLRSDQRLLDLGGGPGTYALAWAKRYRGARVTVFDTADTLAVTRKIFREKGVLGRVALTQGDFLRDPLGGPYDFVWISQILHSYSEQQCVFLFRKVRRALSPGGSAAVQEFLLERDRTSPPGPAYFSVHMVAVTDGGQAYSAGEIAAMFRAAGFARVQEGGPDAGGVGIVRAFV